MIIAKTTFVLYKHMQTEILVHSILMRAMRTEYELVSCPYLAAVIV